MSNADEIDVEETLNFEHVGMAAALMSVNAMAIDIMLPGLGLITRDLNAATGNDQQQVVLAYILGFGIPQVVWGPLSDRYGRRPIIFASLIGYMICGIASALSPTFSFLLAARFAQGVFAAGSRVAATALVRDLFRGAAMARVMSLIMTVFMVIPILAPTIGEGILAIAGWRACLAFLAFFALLIFAWVALRLPETLPAEKRRSFALPSVLSAYKLVLMTPQTFGYMMASGVIFGTLFAYVASSEQVFREAFGQGDRFALWFAVIALFLAAANFTNSRLVGRFGMKRLSRGAVIAFIVLSMTLYFLLKSNHSFWIFLPLFCLCFGLFGLIGANFNAIAMDPLGQVAGTASAAYGFSTTTISALLGAYVGDQYDGTALPMMAGFAILGSASLTLVLLTDFAVKRLGEGAQK